MNQGEDTKRIQSSCLLSFARKTFCLANILQGINLFYFHALILVYSIIRIFHSLTFSKYAPSAKLLVFAYDNGDMASCFYR